MKSFVSLKNWPRCQTAAELLSTEYMDVSNKQKHTCKKMEKQTVEPENPEKRDSLHVTCRLTACTQDQLQAQRSVTSMGKLYLTLPDWVAEKTYSLFSRIQSTKHLLQSSQKVL